VAATIGGESEVRDMSSGEGRARREVPITLETAGVNSYAELAALSTDEVLRRLDDRDVPIHPGDAFLAVILLRGVIELREATRQLEVGTRRVVRLTWALVAVAVITLGVAVIALVKG
jgi:hypothetical protein